MRTLVRLQQIEVLPSERPISHNVSWHELETILAELGEQRGSRIAYWDQTLEIRMPLPGHERGKVLVALLLSTLLDARGQDWESLGSTTFKNQQMQVAIEPDDCCYIRNVAAVVGKERLDLSVDPPCDLAIEVDLTSNTQASAYEALGVPEIWRIKQNQLTILIRKEEGYEVSVASLAWPDFPVIAVFTQYLAKQTEQPMSRIRREFQQWLQQRSAELAC
jgi:Uma2 family endonuclease